MENKPEKCATCKQSCKADGWVVCANCIHDSSRKDRYEPLTNGDKIRGMTDEELAEELADYLCSKIQDIGLCEKYEKCGQGCFMDYLRSPVEESEK